MNCKPLLYQYDGQVQPQPAYLEINPGKDVECDYSGEIGNAVPIDVRHGIRMRFSVDKLLNRDEIHRLCVQVTPLAKRLIEHSEIGWNGNNYVRIFDEEGKALRFEIADICEEFRPDFSEICPCGCTYCHENGKCGVCENCEKI